MKISRFLLLVGVAIAPFAGRAQPAVSSADAEVAAITALAEAQPGDPEVIGVATYLHAVDENHHRLSAAAFAFYTAHPTDPRRWALVMKAVTQPPLFVQSFGPDVATKGMGDAVVDETAKAAWQAKIDGILTALAAASDVPPDVREKAEWESFARDFRDASRAKLQGQPFDFGPFKARFAAHLARFAGQPALAERASDYLGALNEMMPGEGIAGWKVLAASADPALREQARVELDKVERRAALARRAFELTFTAADGRAVDVAKLRGKVVLVDFWATWCGPCKAEIPNVVANYRKFHARGFEVVGVALENGHLTPKDTPEQRNAKLAKAKEALLAFTAAHDMPWPQYFDGKFWQNDVASQYDINGIPAMFLLDQDGKVVTTDARGPKLEEEIKRLLKL